MPCNTSRVLPRQYPFFDSDEDFWGKDSLCEWMARITFDENTSKDDSVSTAAFEYTG